MKKPKDEPEDEMRPEYDFSVLKGRVRGKYAERYREATCKVEFITDGRGRRVAVILDIAEYQKLLDTREEVESIKAYDEAKGSGEEAIPLEQAIEEIESEQPSHLAEEGE